MSFCNNVFIYWRCIVTFVFVCAVKCLFFFFVFLFFFFFSSSLYSIRAICGFVSSG